MQSTVYKVVKSMLLNYKFPEAVHLSEVIEQSTSIALMKDFPECYTKSLPVCPC